ncbi:MAG: hypothetical protein IJ604_08455 [Prevotella sp.]|nr:hypothetical protein [Prevotella sp.]MBR1463382.1 hypothetical protein [Prevotella sp.]
MSDDISQSVSQGGYGAYDAENRRIREIADELQRLCSLYEAQSPNSKGDGSRFEVEQRQTETFAKSVGLWIPMDEVFDLGFPGPSGNENDTYVSESAIYKVNNLLNAGGICKLQEKILLHNTIFPNTFYSLYGFAGYDGRSVLPVLQQKRICNAHPATQIMIDTYMAALDFNKTSAVGRFCNNTYEVWDLVPRNVLVDDEGDIYIVDAEISQKEQSLL